jgi:hypothetical protein
MYIKSTKIVEQQKLGAIRRDRAMEWRVLIWLLAMGIFHFAMN